MPWIREILNWLFLTRLTILGYKHWIFCHKPRRVHYEMCFLGKLEYGRLPIIGIESLPSIPGDKIFGKNLVLIGRYQTELTRSP